MISIIVTGARNLLAYDQGIKIDPDNNVILMNMCSTEAALLGIDCG